jgi:hypothetical protein
LGIRLVIVDNLNLVLFTFTVFAPAYDISYIGRIADSRLQVADSIFETEKLAGRNLLTLCLAFSRAVDQTVSSSYRILLILLTV